MSTDTIDRSNSGNGHRGVSAVQKSISKKEREQLHGAAFGDFVEVAKDKHGNHGVDDQVTYWDPMAHRHSKPVDYRTDIYKSLESAFEDDDTRSDGVFSELNRLQKENGFSPRRAAEDVAKSLERANYSLPIFVIPDIFVTDEEMTPLADMLPRTAVQEDTIEVDELTDTGDAGSHTEDGSFTENDDTYTNHSYDIVGYSRENAVTDFVELAAQTLRSTVAHTEENQMRAIRQYEERQIVQGTNNDANGFDGLRDTTPAANIEDVTGGQITKERVRENIASLRENGASYDDIIHVTDHQTYSDLKDTLDDFTRYESPGDTIGFGYQALEFDGTMVMETHGTPNSDGSREFWSIDASGQSMAMLQDATLEPLAKTDANETFVTHAYGALASQGTERVYAYEGLA